MSKFLNQVDPNNDCCGRTCDESWEVCDECDEGCPFDGLPSAVAVCSQTESVAGEDACVMNLVLNDADCAYEWDYPYPECPEALSYIAEPVDRWVIGDATSVDGGADGIYGEYYDGETLAYVVHSTPHTC